MPFTNMQNVNTQMKFTANSTDASRMQRLITDALSSDSLKAAKCSTHDADKKATERGDNLVVPDVEVLEMAPSISLRQFFTPISLEEESLRQVHVLKERKDQSTEYKWEVVWSNVILLFLLHLGALYGFYLKLTSPNHGYVSSAAGKFFAVASSIGITAGAHRLWTHRSYKASYPIQILLMILSTMTYQNSIYTWARDHRLHHKFSETDADPHNAKRGFFFSHIGWLMIRKHPEVKSKSHVIDMSDLRANPIVMFQHCHYFKLVLLIAVIMPITIERLVIGVPWRETIFIYTIYRYVVSVNTTWCINSLAHTYGYKPYNTRIGPTENPLMKIIGMGEGFHNYHHTYPWDYRASEFNNDCRNITTLLIDFLASIGLVWDRRKVSQLLIDQRVNNSGDPSTRDSHMLYETTKKSIWNVVYFGLVCSYIILA